MWQWFFIFFVILLMLIVHFISSRRDKPFPGIKAFFPRYNEETGEELAPYYKNKSQLFIEKLTKAPLPYFETTINLYEKSSNCLKVEWSVGDNFKNYLAQKMGPDFWEKSQGVLRVNYTGAPNPYYQDIPVDLKEKQKEITINAPGQTVNCQLGIITDRGLYMPIAQSNDVIIPKNN
ncbi:MAG: DUF4912 domain-containing protein [Clostridia bacterium]|nr:DUF4912 domain-containing protein [Clostridia bacterium]